MSSARTRDLKHSERAWVCAGCFGEWQQLYSSLGSTSPPALAHGVGWYSGLGWALPAAYASTMVCCLGVSCSMVVGGGGGMIRGLEIVVGP